MPIYPDDGTGNESLIVEGAVGGDDDVLFLVDTACRRSRPLPLVPRLLSRAARGRHEDDAPGGPPVLFLAAARATRVAWRFRRLRDGSSLSTYDLHEALNEFSAISGAARTPRGARCVDGIGATSEAQSDMFLCPPSTCPRSSRRFLFAVDADVLVTNGSTALRTS